MIGQYDHILVVVKMCSIVEIFRRGRLTECKVTCMMSVNFKPFAHTVKLMTPGSGIQALGWGKY